MSPQATPMFGGNSSEGKRCKIVDVPTAHLSRSSRDEVLDHFFGWNIRKRGGVWKRGKWWKNDVLKPLDFGIPSSRKRKKKTLLDDRSHWRPPCSDLNCPLAGGPNKVRWFAYWKWWCVHIFSIANSDISS